MKFNDLFGGFEDLIYRPLITAFDAVFYKRHTSGLSPADGVDAAGNDHQRSEQTCENLSFHSRYATTFPRTVKHGLRPSRNYADSFNAKAQRCKDAKAEIGLNPERRLTF